MLRGPMGAGGAAAERREAAPDLNGLVTLRRERGSLASLKAARGGGGRRGLRSGVAEGGSPLPRCVWGPRRTCPSRARGGGAGITHLLYLLLLGCCLCAPIFVLPESRPIVLAFPREGSDGRPGGLPWRATERRESRMAVRACDMLCPSHCFRAGSWGQSPQTPRGRRLPQASPSSGLALGCG